MEVKLKLPLATTLIAYHSYVMKAVEEIYDAVNLKEWYENKSNITCQELEKYFANCDERMNQWLDG